jgi:hypothetical protein
VSGFGRRIPEDWEHVEGYPLEALLEDVAHPLTEAPSHVEKSLGLPPYWKTWDQGREGACVGFGTSAMMGVTNTRQSRMEGKPRQHKYEPRWLYKQAQLVDEWNVTPPQEGTSVRAGCDILRTRGHRRMRYGKVYPEDTAHGISANRWAVNVDEMRSAIFANMAISIGVNWYSNFDSPVLVDGERWVGQSSLGRIRGGHCVCVYRMSDRRGAFKIMNSWGAGYAPIWMPYATMQRLLNEDGEAAVITDR